MKQILYNIYLEHKSIKAVEIIELTMIILALFSGILFKTIWIGYWIFCLFSSLQILTYRPGTQIEFFLPLSKKDIKKTIIIKALIVAGTFSFSIMGGFILTISSLKKYIWDKENLAFIMIFMICLSCYFFYLRIEAEKLRFFGSPKFDKKEKIININSKKDVITLIIVPINIFLSFAIFYLFMEYKFSDTGMFELIGREHFIITIIPFITIMLLLWALGISVSLKDWKGIVEYEH